MDLIIWLFIVNVIISLIILGFVNMINRAVREFLDDWYQEKLLEHREKNINWVPKKK
jgi:hypothetical protein